MRRTIALVAAAATVWAACTDAATTTTPPATTRPAPPATTTTATTTTTVPVTVDAAPVTTTSAPPVRTMVAPDCPDLARGEGTAELAAFRDDGTRLWHIPLGGRRMTAAELAGGAAILGFADGLVAALDVASCEELWRLPRDGPVTEVLAHGAAVLIADATHAVSASVDSGELNWEAPGSASPSPAPDGAVLLADGDQLVAREADGAIRWRAPLPDGPLAGIAASEDAAFAVSATAVVARELATGERRWTQDVAAVPRFVPVVQGGTLYLTGEAALVSLDLDDGAERWRFEPAGGVAFLGPPRLDHNEIHVLDDAGRLHHLRRSDGSVVFTGAFAAGRTVPSRDGRLVLTTENGAVTAHNLLERRQWSVVTGADGVSRVSTITVAGDLILAYTVAP